MHSEVKEFLVMADKMAEMAPRFGWPINRNHCFMRVYLDWLFQDCWYDHLDPTKKAWMQLSPTQAAAMVEMMKQTIATPPLLEFLNTASKNYRIQRLPVGTECYLFTRYCDLPIRTKGVVKENYGLQVLFETENSVNLVPKRKLAKCRS